MSYLGYFARICVIDLQNVIEITLFAQFIFRGFQWPLLGTDGGTKSSEFSEKFQGGVIFNPKTYVADFGNFKQGFLIMKLIQKSNFRVQGMFFQQLY